MPNQTGSRIAEGKAVTRYNAAGHGIYSVTPVPSKIERQAKKGGSFCGSHTPGAEIYMLYV